MGTPRGRLGRSVEAHRAAAADRAPYADEPAGLRDFYGEITGMDRAVGEIRGALCWLHHHAPELGFDAKRIHVAGHSAGGHLSAMALATDWPELGLPADVIKGVCAISGVFDLEPVRLCYLNDVLNLTVQQARRNSPMQLAPRARCPVLVTVGAEETPAFLGQSRRYADLLAAAGVACEHRVLPGLDHFAIVQTLAEPDNAMVQWLEGVSGNTTAPAS